MDQELNNTPINETEDENVSENENVNESATESANKTASEKTTSEKTIDSVDHHSLSKEELVKRFKYLLHNFDLGHLKGEVELIRSAFYIQHNKEQSEHKQKFLDEGGLEVDYLAPVDEHESLLKELFSEYRERKSVIFHKLEKTREESLQEKHKIIEEIKGLINKDESLAKTFDEFRTLQQRWRDSGMIPQAQISDLWETYHHHVENFYDYININKELRDLDFKKNLEQKNILCERAEELENDPSPINAFNELQEMHKQWREIGPVSREVREEIWNRFKLASSVINKNNQKFYEDQREEQKKTIQEKVSICEQIEAINIEDINNAKDWNTKSNEVLKLQTLWKELKPVPRSFSDKIFKRFRAACDAFFNKKRDFYASYKKTQDENYQLKENLCLRAEEMQDSDNWNEASQFFINLQKEWKTVGAVHRKHSDIIWARFRKACNHFFERKTAQFSAGEDNQSENLKLKQQLIEEIQAYEVDSDMSNNQLMITSYRDRWQKIGHIPFNMKEKLQTQFREAIDSIFSKLDMNEDEKEHQILLSRIEEIKNQPDGMRKLDLERTKVANKLKELEADIQVWENNIGFFSSSSNKSNNMLEGFQKKIEDGKVRIKKLKAKLKLIDQQYKR